MPNALPLVLYPRRKVRQIDQVGGSGTDTFVDNITQIINQTVPTNLDQIDDGVSYERTAASELSSGIYKDATDSVKGIATFPTSDFSVSSGSVTMVSASTTVAGKIEIAIASEVNTGTDATRAISPDSLAGSNLGTKVIGVIAIERATNITVGNGKADVLIPAAMNGMNLIRAQAVVITQGTTNATTVAIFNVTDTQEMLSTNISIASGQTVGTPGTIDTSYDDVATNDVLRIDVDAVSTTAPQGLLVVLEFQLP